MEQRSFDFDGTSKEQGVVDTQEKLSQLLNNSSPANQQYATSVGYYTQPTVNFPCPHCGYCPHCGRSGNSNANAFPYWNSYIR